MLGSAVRTLDTAALALSAYSPSKTGRVRVTSTRYRRDPYKVKVVPSPHTLMAAAEPEPEPIFAPSARPHYASEFCAAAGFHLAAAHDDAAPEEPFVPAPMMAMGFSSSESAISDVASSDAFAAPAPAPKAEAAPAAAGRRPATQPRYALVAFKHEAMMFLAPFRIAVGDEVVVEADRGEHIGRVKEITKVAPKFAVPCRVLRHATAHDLAMLDAMHQKESRTNGAVQKLAESIGLGIKIVDTEFQVDGNKLTVFFASKVFVDFRKLQRSLFREYRCRIWLVNWAEINPHHS